MTTFKASQQPLESVTVFRSSTAELVRSFTVNLKAGQNTVTISELSSAIKMESVRVIGLGAGARVFDVACTIEKRPTATHIEPSDALRELRDKKKLLEGERDLLMSEAKFLVQYANSVTAAYVKPEGALAFFEHLSKRQREGAGRIKKLSQEILELDELHWQELGRREGDCRAQATVVIVSKNDCTTKLKLAYLVTQAKWEPCYDLFASTTDDHPSSTVSLHYCARITQKTGEDWRDATLVLSTSSAQNVETSIPEIKSLKVRKRSELVFDRPAQKPFDPASGSLFGPTQTHAFQQATASTGGGLFGATPFGNTAPASGTLFGGGGNTASNNRPFPATAAQSWGLFGQKATQQVQQQSQPVVATASSSAQGGNDGDHRHEDRRADTDWEYDVVEGQHSSDNVTAGESAILESTASVVRKSPLASTYRVEGSATVPSDGVAHRVLLAALDLTAVISHICVPRVRAAAFIQCKVENTSEYYLLAGPVSVMLDDSYVSRFTMLPTGPNDFFTCTLGVDTSLRVSYERSASTQEDKFHAFAEQSKQTTVTVRAKIENLHTSPVSSLVVRDAIPTSEDPPFKVVLLKPLGLSIAEEDLNVEVFSGDRVPEQAWKVCWVKAADGKGGEKEGKFEWSGPVPGGKVARLEAQWVVTSPVSLEWDEVTQPLGARTSER